MARVESSRKGYRDGRGKGHALRSQVIIWLTGEILFSSNMTAFVRHIGELAENRVAEIAVSLLAPECSGGSFLWRLQQGFAVDNCREWVPQSKQNAQYRPCARQAHSSPQIGENLDFAFKRRRYIRL